MLREIFTPGHILLIAIVALVFFGPSKLPELGRGVGKMLREFKSGTKGLISDEEVKTEQKQETPTDPDSAIQYVEAKPVSTENKRMLP
jgi:sec-independent protein translocase protein TatA